MEVGWSSTHRSTCVLLVDPARPPPQIESVLAEEGFTVRVAVDSADALELATANAPAVALVMLGVADAPELVAALDARDIPVIAMAAAPPSTIDVVTRSRLFAVLIEPVRTEPLVVALERARDSLAMLREVATVRARIVQLERDSQRYREAQRDRVATVAHDVRASLAIIALVLSSLEADLPASTHRKVALARDALARAGAILKGAIEIDSVPSSGGPEAGQHVTAASR